MFLTMSQLDDEIATIAEKIEKEDDDFDSNWNAIYWSFMARSEKCGRQKWHCDYENGYFAVFPMYPYGTLPKWFTENEDDTDLYYDIYVIRGSHKVPWKEVVNKQDNVKNVLKLQLTTGQVLIAKANLVHSGGPNAHVPNMWGSRNYLEHKKYIGAIKNLSIHAYVLHEADFDVKSLRKNKNKKAITDMMKKVGEHTVFVQIE